MLISTCAHPRTERQCSRLASRCRIPIAPRRIETLHLPVLPPSFTKNQISYHWTMISAPPRQCAERSFAGPFKPQIPIPPTYYDRPRHRAIKETPAVCWCGSPRTPRRPCTRGRTLVSNMPSWCTKAVPAGADARGPGRCPRALAVFNVIQHSYDAPSGCTPWSSLTRVHRPVVFPCARRHHPDEGRLSTKDVVL
jgi:hypothetical protein